MTEERPGAKMLLLLWLNKKEREMLLAVLTAVCTVIHCLI